MTLPFGTYSLVSSTLADYDGPRAGADVTASVGSVDIESVMLPPASLGPKLHQLMWQVRCMALGGLWCVEGLALIEGRSCALCREHLPHAASAPHIQCSASNLGV